MGPVWVGWIFSVACLAVAGYHAGVLITSRWVRRDSAEHRSVTGHEWGYVLSHLVMALGMAAMFSPLGDPLSPLVWLIVFGMAGAWFTACLLRAGGPAGDRTSAPAAEATYLHAGQLHGGHLHGAHHHLVANLAMLFMVIGGHHRHGAGEVSADGVAGGQGGPGHEGHTIVAGGGWIEGPIGTVVTVVLAGYFAVHAGRSFHALFSAPPRESMPPAGSAGETAGTGSVAVVSVRGPIVRSRVEAICHVVMGTAMTVMFGLML
ncbi:MAG: DUF5134 domain-containing protein [Pseudonocardiaceae bacterium]